MGKIDSGVIEHRVSVARLKEEIQNLNQVPMEDQPGSILGEPQKLSQIDRELETLFSELSELANVTDLLFKKLHRVMRPKDSQKVPEADTTKGEPLVPLAVPIHRANLKIARLISEFNNTISRLEV